MLILASNSPRRKQLLALGGWEFQVLPVDIDESQLDGEPAGDYVLRLSKNKAIAASHKAVLGNTIVAADTTVADGDEILGKPSSTQEALLMLQRLRGRLHQVFTAISIYDLGSATMRSELCLTEVRMRSYSDQEISAYIDTGDPFDKAGAYAIQHPSFKPVEKITGCFANVVGLPLCHLVSVLAEFDLTPKSDIIQKCQESRQQTCTIRDMVCKE
jgi:MAF protein